MIELFAFSIILQSNFSVHNISRNKTVIIVSRKPQNRPPKRITTPLNCVKNQTQTCPTNYPKTSQTQESISDYSIPPTSTCPDYFRWIHEDLSPWKVTGITRDMLERANQTAHFRLILVNNKVYIHKYKQSIQTRDVFTIWGILQLLRKYPGRLPDLELMFDCDDRPVIRSRDYSGPNNKGPPPLFRAEINIKPWESLLRELKEGNNGRNWVDREPYAYWKGNPFVAETRRDLLTCNLSDKHDWNARLYVQDWILESKQGFQQSNLASQCAHRYKIYIEGYAWSVSEKYILACDSTTLIVKPYFHDFFIRYLQPLRHYWPIRDKDKCKSIKFAVDWGNTHKQKAQEIGRAASNFIQEELKMEYVYDYMFHLLNEYAKLLKFKPVAPDGAVEVCSETMACTANGSHKKFMMESLVKGPSITSPCTLPPPYEPKVLGAFYRRKLNAILQVQKWEDRYWESLKKQ
ncbi:CAP10 domain-containing protein [Citrus sinensis]|uniref:CAP10 domain-containing protein n=1 Tax=Citrus sinensis TaxID=2711 RepID=A0ACB8LQW6_CITSI|nr:CAP10 domain-containing protein [Citrus sinensis]